MSVSMHCRVDGLRGLEDQNINAIQERETWSYLLWAGTPILHSLFKR